MTAASSLEENPNEMRPMIRMTNEARVPRQVRSVARGWVALIVASALATAFASPATASFGIVDDSFDGVVSDSHDAAFTQAGGHPYSASARFDLNTAVDSFGNITLDGSLRNAEVELPAGLIGNPTATPKCTGGVPALLANICPAASQVGVTTTDLAFGDFEFPFHAPIFNMEPPPGKAAAFGFNATVPVFLTASVRADGDYGVDIDARNVSQGAAITATSVTFWGVPADPSHDDDRGFHDIGGLNPEPCVQTPDPVCSHAADIQPKPFLTNPTACTADGIGLETRIAVRSWDGASDDASFVSHLPPGYPLPAGQWGAPQGPTGCDRLPFSPSISVQPDSTKPDSPTGLTVDLTFPQAGLVNPSGLATAHLRGAKVTLPDGMTVNPSSAGGLQSCTDHQSGIGTARSFACPEAAKIGTVEAETPLLDEKLTGGVYVGSQRSDDPESGEMFRLFLHLENEARGLSIKLAGKVRANRATGRLETTFDDNPQLPVSRIVLRLKGGPRAPLATPSSCGAKTVTAELSSWGGQTASLSDSFSIDCPDPPGFAPGFEAGSVSPTGGSFSPFVARISRRPQDQYLSRVDIDMPKGLIAKLEGVQLCPDSVAGDGTPGTCPASSRIGTATVGAGSGEPFYLQGPVHLTGPYKGGPYGLSVQVPAKAGPFDLGMVKVRSALHVDPETAEISVASDALPQVVKGVPVRLRSVSVDVDRPGFTINPTSCAEKRIDATFTSTQEAVSKATQRFQAGDCRSLAFKPRMSMRLTGRKQRKTGGHPGLRVRLTQGTGQANLEGVAVKLPKSLALDPDNAQGLCDYLEARKADPKCPASSIVGRAKAYTPVLNEPLAGPVYFAENKQVNRLGRLISKLPSLVIPLRGEVAINIRQASGVKGGRLVSTTASIPDAPVSRFDLALKGGVGGVLTVTRTATRRFDLCKGRHTAFIETDAQNGRRADFSVRAESPCGKVKRRRAGKARRAKRHAG